MVEFFGRRYYREAFLDEFERRFRKAKAKFEKILRERLSEILDVYVILEPVEELDPVGAETQERNDRSTYRLWIYVLLTDAVAFGDPRSLNVLKNEVKPAFRSAMRACAGIQLEDVIFAGREDVTLAGAALAFQLLSVLLVQTQRVRRSMSERRRPNASLIVMPVGNRRHSVADGRSEPQRPRIERA